MSDVKPSDFIEICVKVQLDEKQAELEDYVNKLSAEESAFTWNDFNPEEFTELLDNYYLARRSLEFLSEMRERYAS